MPSSEAAGAFFQGLEEHFRQQLAICKAESQGADPQKKSALTEAATFIRPKIHQLTEDLANLEKADPDQVLLSACRQLAMDGLKALLDVTFARESSMHEGAFSNAEDFTSLLKELSETPGKLAALYQALEEPQNSEQGAEASLVALFGADVVEIIHWRVGSLVYMVTHVAVVGPPPGSPTAKQPSAGACMYKDRPLPGVAGAVLTPAMVEQGVAQLQAMRQVRLPGVRGLTEADANGEESKAVAKAVAAAAAREFQVQSEGGQEVKFLLSHQIYSQTHLLSCMYGGELCFWRLSLTSPSAPALAPEVVQRYKKIGIELLSVYCKVVQKVPALRASWNTDRAKELLGQLFKIKA